jgi:uncharacterized protein YdaU (DUF1376 family)
VNHYPRHIGDYLKKTIGLTMLQDGAYNRMLDLYYGEESPLPLDKAEIYAATRCQTKADREAVDHCLRKYFSETPDGYRHDRCDDELLKFSDKSAKASASASKKWINRNANAMPTHPPNDANAMRTHSEGICERNAESMLASNQNHKPKPEGGGSGVNRPPEPRATTATHLADLWPKGLTIETWEEWRKHLLCKGKPMSPPSEKVQLHRLAEHADPDRTVRDAIAAGHASLPPPGGWPSQQQTKTQADKRAAVAAAIFPNQDRNRDDTAIDGTAERVA